jgi:hypothetical protein
MPGLNTILHPGDADQLLADIIKQANDERAAQEARP